MQADELITKADRFAHDFIKELSDTSTTVASRQAYMLDNQEKLQKVMGSLQTVITAMGEQQETLDEDDEAMLDKGKEIVANLRAALDTFRKELNIDENTKDEDLVPVVNEQTIGDAMSNNSTTQKIAKDLKNIQDQQTMPFNYAISCDGNITLITATNKKELNATINNIANGGKYKDIKLFELKATPVPLHQKTVLSV